VIVSLFHVTILTQVVIGILDLWNASTYHSIPPKFSRKAAIRPIVPIDLWNASTYHIDIQVELLLFG
jgi:hypothetical protein